MRSQPIIDPNLLWWRSLEPVMLRRLSSPAEVVRHRVSEEDEHVRRYMVALECKFDNTWQVLQGSQSYTHMCTIKTKDSREDITTQF